MKSGIDYIGVGVGALIFDNEGKIFLAKRGKKAKNERGKWEIPGGSVEFGETFEQAVKREIKEEIGVDIEVVKLLDVYDHLIPDEKQHWVTPTFICKIIAGEPRILEPEKLEEIGWFSKEEMEKMSLSIISQKNLVSLEKQTSPNPSSRGGNKKGICFSPHAWGEG